MQTFIEISTELAGVTLQGRVVQNLTKLLAKVTLKFLSVFKYGKYIAIFAEKCG